MVDIRPLNSELQKFAKEKLNEDPDLIEGLLKEFCDWIDKTPHLRARKDDQFLIAFLRSSKFDLEAAKRQLNNFYTIRYQMPEILRDRDPTTLKLKAIIRLGVGIPLPYTEYLGGPRFYLIRPGAFDPIFFKIEDVIKVSTMINDILMRDDDNWTIMGQIGILDLANVTGLHLKQLSPHVINQWTKLSNDSYPVRLRGFHYINAPPGFKEIFKTFLTCMNEDIRTSIFVHGTDLETFYETVPRYLMPIEYGGSIYSVKDVIKEWEEKINSYRQYFEEEEEQYGIDESKRIKNGTKELKTEN